LRHVPMMRTIPQGQMVPCSSIPVNSGSTKRQVVWKAVAYQDPHLFSPSPCPGCFQNEPVLEKDLQRWTLVHAIFHEREVSQCCRKEHHCKVQ
jgi:hypothetical protein